jgi:hypothetical protein
MDTAATSSSPDRVLSPAVPVPEDYELLCDGCGYSLIGLMTDRCPECGRQFDPTALPLARVPWLYRRRLGFITAYVRTVWMVITQPRVFAAELSRPVRISFEDARRFRWTTIWLVTAVAVLGAVVSAAVMVAETYSAGLAVPSNVYAVSAIAPLAGGVLLLFGLWGSTDMPTFIWQGTTRPDDLGPLHHYASAPLVLFVPVLLLSGVGALLYRSMGPTAEMPIAIGIAVMVAAVCAILWTIPAVVMRAATHCSVARTLLLMAYLPVHWLMMFFIAGTLLAFVMAGLHEIFRL